MKVLALFIPILISTSIYSQQFLTIGEVFDFAVNEEFHFKGQADGQPPNADRIFILDKYYSANYDTVYYVRYHDSYYTTPLLEPPYLEYHFWIEIDTISYTNLDSAITSYNQWTSFDTTMTYYDTIIGPSEYYCDSLINGYQYTINSFEPVYYSNEFGKGIGLVTNFYFNPAEFSMYDNVLFYYKKNDMSCGIIDTTTVSLPDLHNRNDFKVYPNPVSNILKIENTNNIVIESISLTNINGQTIQHFDPRKTKLDVSKVNAGLYILFITSNEGELIAKVLIER